MFKSDIFLVKSLRRPGLSLPLTSITEYLFESELSIDTSGEILNADDLLSMLFS